MKKEFVFKVFKISISVDYMFFAVIFIMLVLGHIFEFLIILASILFHEFGHIATAAWFKCKVSILRILPVGLNAVLDIEECTRHERLIIYLSGPLVNILAAFFFIAAYLYIMPHSSTGHFSISVNIYLAAFNLLPVMPLDGGRILKDVLAERFGIFLTSRLIKHFSLYISAGIIIVGLFQFLNDLHEFSLLIIGFYILTSSFKGMEAAMMNIKDVIYRRSRLLKKGIYPARDLVVVRSMQLSDVIKSLDFDRFHIIHVLDEDLKLVKIFTEQEIIDGMIKHNADITFEELIKKAT